MIQSLLRCILLNLDEITGLIPVKELQDSATGNTDPILFPNR